ncbi:MAG: pentapeptide repeat-containing protein, partial [Myxococcota bacterium]
AYRFAGEREIAKAASADGTIELVGRYVPLLDLRALAGRAIRTVELRDSLVGAVRFSAGGGTSLVAFDTLFGSPLRVPPREDGPSAPWNFVAAGCVFLDDVDLAPVASGRVAAHDSVFAGSRLGLPRQSRDLLQGSWFANDVRISGGPVHLSFPDVTFEGALGIVGSTYEDVRLDGLSARGLEISETRIARRLTLENARIDGDVDLRFVRVGDALNLSRADIGGSVDLQDVRVGRLVALGTEFRDIVYAVGLDVEEDLQLSLNDAERAIGELELSDLTYRYRFVLDGTASGTPSYGVQTLDDLVSRVHAGFALNASSIGRDLVLRDVVFGAPGGLSYVGLRGLRVGGAGQLEGAVFHGTADLTDASFDTVLDLSGSRFGQDLVLDGVTVQGRLDLRSSTFDPDATIPMGGATVGRVQGEWEQIRRIDRPGASWLRLTELPFRGFPLRVAGILIAWGTVVAWWVFHRSRLWLQPGVRRWATPAQVSLAVSALGLGVLVETLLGAHRAAVVLGVLSAIGPILLGRALAWPRTRTLALAGGAAALGALLLVATYVFVPRLTQFEVEWALAVVPVVGTGALYLLEVLRAAAGPLVFISYRRSDDPGFTGRLHDHLVYRMPEARFFMDTDAVQMGQTFGPQLARAVQECDAMLVVIGAGWADATTADGRRRLEIEEDWVRQEIELALLHDRSIVPVLLRETPLPQDDALPSSLRPLLGFTAVRVSHEGFATTSQQLVRTIRGLL